MKNTKEYPSNQKSIILSVASEPKKWKTPKITELDLIETKGGYFNWNYESPDWIPISHS